VQSDVLFEAYKERLGSSQRTSMVFDMSTLIQDEEDLAALEELFST
jgi:hypothetical protein